jgi:purine-binding chemotaxis protein CheW
VLVSKEDELLSGFVILEVDGLKLGIIIDRVARVVTVDKSERQPPPQMLSGIGAEYIEGVVRQDDGYLIIMNISNMFNSKELRKIPALRK